MSEDDVHPKGAAHAPRRARSCLSRLAIIAAILGAVVWARDTYETPLLRWIMTSDEVAQGFACADQLDGSIHKLNRLIRAELPDPASFDHVQTLYGNPEKTNDGLLKVGDVLAKSQFRARNRQGGMEFETALASLDPQTCEVTLIRITPDSPPDSGVEAIERAAT